jgi:hypothetical protein
MGVAREEGAALEKVTALFKTEKEKAWDEWEVLEMNVQEKIGQPTYGQLVIAATKQNFDFSPLLGKSCVLILSRGYDRKRYFKGLVFRIEHRGEYPFGSVARIDFATAVRALQHGQDSRVFENRTAPQILEEVFKEALEPFWREVRLKLSRTYPVREYCVQYKESDWDFVQRLMADEGITFYLDEGGKETDRETVVLVDSNDSFPEIETVREEEPVEPLEALRPESQVYAGKIVGPAGPLAHWPFLLKRDGAALDQRSLGGSSPNTYKNGAWISGSGGEFRFEDMPAAEYSVEAIFAAGSLEENTKPPPPGVGESGQRAATPASPPGDEEPADGVEDLAWVRPPRVNEFGEWITTEFEPAK